MTANLSLHGFVTGSIISTLRHDAQNIEATADDTFGPLSPGAAVTITRHLESGDLTPDQADVFITITNDQGYGPS